MKNLKAIFTVSAILLLLCSRAQDVITLKTGDELNVKVEKIDTATISYYNQADTALHTMQKSEVFMIKFSNGAKYVIAEVGNNNNTTVAPEDRRRKPEELKDYSYYDMRYNRKKRLGIAFTTIGGTFAATGISLSVFYSTEMNKPYANTAQLAGTVGGIMLSAASSPFLIVGITNLAALPKFKKLRDGTSASLSIAPSVEPGTALYGPQTGLAMRLTF